MFELLKKKRERRMTSEKRYTEDKPWVCGGGKIEDANKEIIEGLQLRRMKGQVGS